MLARKESQAVIWAAISLVAGFVINWYWPKTKAFPRSGSVVVCIGIFFALRDLIPKYRAEYETTLDWLESKRAEHDIVPSLEALRNKARGTTDYAKDLAKRRGEESIRRAVTVDTSLLLTGTLVWSFGDIPFKWLIAMFSTAA